MTAWNDFLATGRLGPIVPGETPIEVVRDILGPPEDVSQRKIPLILKYGSLQFTFNRPPDGSDLILSSVGIDLGSPNPNSPETF